MAVLLCKHLLKVIHPTSIYMQKFRVYQLHKVSILCSYQQLERNMNTAWHPEMPVTIPSPVSTQAHLFPKGLSVSQLLSPGVGFSWAVTEAGSRSMCSLVLDFLCSTQCLWGSPTLFHAKAVHSCLSLLHIPFRDHTVHALLRVHTWFLPIPSYHE